MDDKDLKELLHHKYPDFDNKGKEICELAKEGKKKKFINKKLIFVPASLLVLIIIIIFVFIFNGNNGTKICEGVYVSAASFDLSSNIDLSVCEGIKQEERDDLIVILEEVHSGAFSNMWGYNHPFYFNFIEDNMSYIIYDNCFSYKGTDNNNAYYEDDNRYILWNKFNDWLKLSDENKKALLEDSAKQNVLIIIQKDNHNYGYIILELEAYYRGPIYSLCTKMSVLKSVIFPKVNGEYQKISNEQIIMLYKDSLGYKNPDDCITIINDILGVDGIKLPEGKLELIDKTNDNTLDSITLKVTGSSDYNEYHQYIEEYLGLLNYSNDTKTLRCDKIDNFDIYRNVNSIERYEFSLYYHKSYYLISVSHIKDSDNMHSSLSSFIIFDYFENNYGLNLSFLKNVKFIKSVNIKNDDNINRMEIYFDVYNFEEINANKELYYSYLNHIEEYIDKSYIKTELIKREANDNTNISNFNCEFTKVEQKDNKNEISSYFLYYSHDFDNKSYLFGVGAKEVINDVNYKDMWPNVVVQSAFNNKIDISDFEGNYISYLIAYDNNDNANKKVTIRLFGCDNNSINEYLEKFALLGFMKDANNVYKKTIQDNEADIIASIEVVIMNEYTDFIYRYEPVRIIASEYIEAALREYFGIEISKYIPIIITDDMQYITTNDYITIQVYGDIDNYLERYGNQLIKFGYRKIEYGYEYDIEGIGTIKINPYKVYTDPENYIIAIRIRLSMVN